LIELLETKDVCLLYHFYSFIYDLGYQIENNKPSMSIYAFEDCYVKQCFSWQVLDKRIGVFLVNKTSAEHMSMV